MGEGGAAAFPHPSPPFHSITTCHPDRREGSREIFRIVLLENTSFHPGLQPLTGDSFFARVIVLTCFSIFIASGNLSKSRASSDIMVANKCKRIL